jgi:hypothetical protein
VTRRTSDPKQKKYNPGYDTSAAAEVLVTLIDR